MSTLPNAILKRDLLHGVKNSSHVETAKKFESEGWLSDAIDFYWKADDRDAMIRIQGEATKEGNAFLVLKVARLLKQDESSLECVKTVAQVAESMGKIRYAISAYEKCGQTSKVRELRESIKSDGGMILQNSADVFIPDEPLADG